jgi:hypothetical protein
MAKFPTWISTGAFATAAYQVGRRRERRRSRGEHLGWFFDSSASIGWWARSEISPAICTNQDPTSIHCLDGEMEIWRGIDHQYLGRDSFQCDEVREERADLTSTTIQSPSLVAAVGITPTSRLLITSDLGAS